jgi:hypothetical protein
MGRISQELKSYSSNEYCINKTSYDDLTIITTNVLLNFKKLTKMLKLGMGKTTYTFSANANAFPFSFCQTPPRLLVTR